MTLPAPEAPDGLVCIIGREAEIDDRLSAVELARRDAVDVDVAERLRGQAERSRHVLELDLTFAKLSHGTCSSRRPTRS